MMEWWADRLDELRRGGEPVSFIRHREAERPDFADPLVGLAQLNAGFLC